MAGVIAQHLWQDGSATTIHVEVENDYPDALSQARAEAVRGLLEAVAEMAETDHES